MNPRAVEAIRNNNLDLKVQLHQIEASNDLISQDCIEQLKYQFDFSRECLDRLSQEISEDDSSQPLIIMHRELNDLRHLLSSIMKLKVNNSADLKKVQLYFDGDATASKTISAAKSSVTQMLAGEDVDALSPSSSNRIEELSERENDKGYSDQQTPKLVSARSPTADPFGSSSPRSTASNNILASLDDNYTDINTLPTWSSAIKTDSTPIITPCNTKNFINKETSDNVENHTHHSYITSESSTKGESELGSNLTHEGSQPSPKLNTPPPQSTSSFDSESKSRYSTPDQNDANELDKHLTPLLHSFSLQYQKEVSKSLEKKQSINLTEESPLSQPKIHESPIRLRSKPSLEQQAAFLTRENAKLLSIIEEQNAFIKAQDNIIKIERYRKMKQIKARDSLRFVKAYLISEMASHAQMRSILDTLPPSLNDTTRFRATTPLNLRSVAMVILGAIRLRRLCHKSHELKRSVRKAREELREWQMKESSH